MTVGAFMAQAGKDGNEGNDDNDSLRVTLLGLQHSWILDAGAAILVHSGDGWGLIRLTFLTGGMRVKHFDGFNRTEQP